MTAIALSRLIVVGAEGLWPLDLDWTLNGSLVAVWSNRATENVGVSLPTDAFMGVWVLMTVLLAMLTPM